jgi:hypothetical protein
MAFTLFSSERISATIPIRDSKFARSLIKRHNLPLAVIGYKGRTTGTLNSIAQWRFV